MTENTQENTVQEQKPNDKEYNFRRLEAKYQQELALERAKREEMEKKLQEVQSKPEPEEEDNAEPYVDKKNLSKAFNKFGSATQKEISKAMQQAKEAAKQELKEELFLDSNPDFYDVLEKHSEKFAMKSPRLAENILRMPEGFERQKLVYHTIKEMGLDRPEQKAPSIQEKVDANRRSPFYQPSSVGSAPYSQVGDFSPKGQENAYQKMQDLKSRLRLG